MRESTSASTRRTKSVELAQPLEDGRLLEPDAREPLSLITREVAFRTGALTGLLVVRDGSAQRLDVLCAHGTVASEEHLSLSASNSGFVGSVVESGQAACEPIAVGQTPQLAAAAANGQVSYAAGASVGPPGRTSGALCVGLSARPRDPEATMWIVESYARMAALCLHDPGVLDGFLAAARYDALTGCLNYASIRSELEREIGRSSRLQLSLCCCFIDLDGFKSVNERYGHPQGSLVLAEVAAVLRAGVRIGDRVGRYGGDEFVVLLPDTSRRAAHALVARLRARICTTTIETGPDSLDASVGIAKWRAGMTVDQLLGAADHALRSAKRSGGHTVIDADDVEADSRQVVA